MNRLVPLAMLVLGASPALAQVRSTSSLPSMSAPLPLGVKTPKLLRADQPNRPPADETTGDPSLATDYDAEVDGINLNGVGYLQTPVPGQPDYAYYCTASRIGPMTLIAAAHCVTDKDTGALLSTVGGTTATFLGPGSTLAAPEPVTFTASSVVVRPDWRGFFTESTSPKGQVGKDVAILNFSSILPSWITTYALYAGGPLFQNTTQVGYGGYGNGDQGDVGFDVRRRWGQNVVDFYTDNPVSADWNILYTDFDDGTEAHDAFCLFGAIFCDLGRGDMEASTAGGDSGGPLFIDGELAAVTSFGTYFCGPGPGCPPAVPGLKNADVIDGFGAVNGFAGVMGNDAFIRANIAAVPEPATIVLVGGGLLALAGIARRRA